MWTIDDLGPGDSSHTPWMTPDTDMRDGEVTRDGRRLVATYDYGTSTRLAFYAVTGDVRSETPPGEPVQACTSTGPDERYGDPSWSPDGSGLAFESSEGIETLRFTELDASGCATTGSSTVLSATGASPDWGPADPPAARFTPPPAARPLELESAQTSRKAVRKGLVVRLYAPAAGRVKVRLSLGRRKLASGSAVAKGPGTVKVRLSGIPKQRARTLSGRTLTFTATHAGATATGTVTLR